MTDVFVEPLGICIQAYPPSIEVKQLQYKNSKFRNPQPVGPCFAKKQSLKTTFITHVLLMGEGQLKLHSLIDQKYDVA